jgi:hypothetical protein
MRRDGCTIESGLTATAAYSDYSQFSVRIRKAAPKLPVPSPLTGMFGVPRSIGFAIMTERTRHRTPTVALLIVVGGAGVFGYARSPASEPRTAAGREPAPTVQRVGGLSERRNRTVFAAPKRVEPARTFEDAEPARRTAAGLAESPVVSAAEQPVASNVEPPQLLDLPQAGPTNLAASRQSSQSTPVNEIYEDELTDLELIALQPTPNPPSAAQDQAPPIITPAPTAGELIPVPSETVEPKPFAPLSLSSIGRATTSIAPPAGELPRNLAALAQPSEPQPLAQPGEPPQVTAPYYSTPRVPDFTHRPLYFEEQALERNGRTIGVLQPGLSAAHFFGTIPILPYKMGAQPPSRPMYTGNGIDPPSDHLSVRDRVRGVMAEAGVVLGLNYILP